VIVALITNEEKYIGAISTSLRDSNPLDRAI
jgi:hypothetical protein